MSRHPGLKRILADFRRHPWLHLLSISTITVSLVILGAFFLCYRNFQKIAEKTNPGATGTVYLKEGLTPPQIETLKQQVAAMDGVQGVTYKSREAVVADLQVFLSGANNETLPGSDLFPNVLEIELKKDSGMDTVVALKTALNKQSEVSEVDFSEDWLTQYRRVRHFLKIFGGLLMAGIVCGCGFIIANFMGMRHQARKQEIEIVWLIGGHRNFVLAPFLWEGLIEGILGAFLALGFLYLAKTGVAAVMSVQWSNLLGMREWLYLSGLQLLGVILLGIAMAFIGSISVFLRFRENSTA